MPYVIFYCVISYMFSGATMTVFESFSNSARKLLCWSLFFSLKWQNYTNPYFCQDWHHKCAKNTVDIFILQGILLWILGKWFMKALKKVIHFTTNISIYTGYRHFEVIMLIFLCICIKHSQHQEIRKNSKLNFMKICQASWFSHRRLEISKYFFHSPDRESAQKVTPL